MAATFDIVDIVDCLQGTDDATSFLANVETGELHAQIDDYGMGGYDDELDEEELEDGNWIALPDKYDIDEWRMMRDFARIQVGDAADALLDAIHGSGAFRLFKRELNRLGLREEWYRYQDDRYREIAIQWLEENHLSYTDSSRAGGKRQIGRITAMERSLDEVVAANKALGKALRRYSQAQGLAAELGRYLGSDEWHAAREADEAGQLPADLKRGVLSEDAAYNALADNRTTAISLLEAATSVLRQ